MKEDKRKETKEQESIGEKTGATPKIVLRSVKSWLLKAEDKLYLTVLYFYSIPM